MAKLTDLKQILFCEPLHPHPVTHRRAKMTVINHAQKIHISRLTKSILDIYIYVSTNQVR